MTKLTINLVFLVAVHILSVVLAQNELPKAVQPNNIKIYVEDHSELVKDPSSINKDDIQVAQPIGPVDESKQHVDPKQGKVETAPELTDKLPVMPLFFNPFSGIFDQQQQESPAEGEEAKPPQMRGIISVLLMKSYKQSNDDGEQAAEPEAKSKLLILKYMPKKFDNYFSEQEKTEGEVKKTIPLLGGGGENDPDMMRFRLDSNNKDLPHMMTGNDDVLINSHMINHHKFSMHSMMDRMKQFFNLNTDQDLDEREPFIIRTDDGAQAIIPNESDPKAHKPKPNCMMLNFMRLKASIYYRTILHMLFFTGILLFILSMIMITFRTFRRRRYSTLRYSPHNMNVASIDGELCKSKFGSVKGWYDLHSDRSTLIRGPQAPPAYDQVIINDGVKKVSATYKYSNLASDEDREETKSLPPSFDQVTEKKPDQA